MLWLCSVMTHTLKRPQEDSELVHDQNKNCVTDLSKKAEECDHMITFLKMGTPTPICPVMLQGHVNQGSPTTSIWLIICNYSAYFLFCVARLSHIAWRQMSDRNYSKNNTEVSLDHCELHETREHFAVASLWQHRPLLSIQGLLALTNLSTNTDRLTNTWRSR